MTTDICNLINIYNTSTDYDNCLFLVQISLGFNQLLQLAELCISDNAKLHNTRKMMMRFDVTHAVGHLQLKLPGHKADKFFEGSKLIVLDNNNDICPHPWILKYLHMRDAKHPWHPELWLQDDGSYPSRSWFTSRLRRHFSLNISGHSMHAGGATALTAAGIPDDQICVMGRWSSDAYQA